MSASHALHESANEPAVSVVMPVRNVERFLGEAMQSVLAQTFENFEFIIVDYGSTDGSKSIISKYAAEDSRVKFHEIPPCSLPVARNAGCYKAQGKYIAIMDADDVALPERLKREVEFMESHPRIALLGSAVQWIDASGRLLDVHSFPRDYQEIWAEQATRCTFWHSTVLVRRDAFLYVGGYRPAFIYSHDYDFEQRIVEHFECANVDQVLARYRIHPTQITFDKQKQQTVCKLAVRISVASRRAGRPDPLDGIEEITPAILSKFGVSEAEQENASATDGAIWIRGMTAAQEYSAALQIAEGMLGAYPESVERWQVADMHLAIARIYRKQGKRWKCLSAAIKAAATRPVIIGRSLKPLLQRLGIV